MSRATRNRHRRIRPYAWLGAGAVTLGLGAGIVSGAAVAFADSGTDAGAAPNPPTAASQTAGDSSPQKKTATRGGRGAASTTADNSVVERRVTLPAPAAALAELAEGATTAVTDAAGPRVSVTRTARSAPATAPNQTPALSASPQLVQPSEPAADSGAAPAASVPAPAPVVDPAPSTTSWLPATPIVPGAHVQLALQEMAQARAVLQQQTWGSGNVFGGLAAIVPELFIMSASLSLGAWQSTSPIAQNFLALTANIPIARQVAQLTLVADTLLTNVSQLSLRGAQLFLPLVGVFGAPGAVAATEPLLAAALSDGTVYAFVPLRIKASTEPVARVSINNGSRVPLLVDTGASGIVVVPSAVPNLDQLTPVSSGNSCFSGNLCYHYETYQTTVDFGGGAVTDTGYVNVVTDNDRYPTSVADFTDYFAWGADGIVGVGANTVGPGPAPIANATLPGELSDGVLILQGLLPLGLGGVLVFGPNPLPTRVSLPGAPIAYVKVRVNGGPLTDAGAIIDSGGVTGTLPLANAPVGSVVGQDLPGGTKISVYAPDGTTLLYTYTTRSAPRGTPVIATGLMNTGNAPFAKDPIYMNYAGPGSGIGSTDFSIW